jgi:hypothetical protein
VGSLNHRVEHLEDRFKPGVVVQLHGFETQQDADRYRDQERPRSDHQVLRRVYIGVDIEAV